MNVHGCPVHLPVRLHDEIQPLRNGKEGLSPVDLSPSHHKSDTVRRCVILLVLNLVLVLAVIAAFIIDGSLDVNLKMFREMLEVANVGSWIIEHKGNHHLELEPVAKKFTLLDVHPPIVDSHGLLEELHSGKPSKLDSLLVPLPRHTLPLHYDLLLDLTRIGSSIIRGNLTIHLDSLGNAGDDELWFHAGPKLNIERLRLRSKDGKRIYPKVIKREETKKLARLILKERLQRGRYFLDIEYNTTICTEASDDGVHCYKEVAAHLCENSKRQASSINDCGSNVTVITSFTTKFEPALARSFLPCWDEPSIKATFNITVLHEARFRVLSNMPPQEDPLDVVGPIPPQRIVSTTFQETPPMPTYLLAFAVGEFVKLEMRTDRNIPITVWAHKEDFLGARFAANFSPVMFDSHEELFEVPYPLPKMDLIAARAFPVGGMENWGLIIFDHQAVLLDPELEDNVNMTVDRKFREYRIEKLITHEIAHQWFGNLVTMNEWSDLWLNEGFATYFVLELLKDEHPRLTEHDHYTRLALLFRKQSGAERIALVRELRTEREVEDSFHSTHLYTKGCVVVRMLHDLLSDFDFINGVRRYVRKNAFRSISREDLWASLPAHADHGADHHRLATVMEPWLLNDGIPEVFVSRNYETNVITISQRPAQHHHHRAFLKDVGDEHGDVSGVRGPMAVKTRRIRRDEITQSIDISSSPINMRSSSIDIVSPDSRDRRMTSYRRASMDASTPFDDEMFDGLPEDYQRKKQRRKQNRKRKKHPLTTRAPYRPNVDILIESRQEELKRSRRVYRPSDLWSIPFSYMFGSVKSSEGQVVREFWLINRSISFADMELAPSHALVANPDWLYPYRVNYDTYNWKLISRILHSNPSEIPSKSRMQLIVDAETFLAQSEHPHVFLYFLGYLKEEDDLGVALLGLDAMHRLVDQFRGSDIINSLLLYLSPVVSRLDKHLKESQVDAELAALWLIEPQRLSHLYQLRCVTNLHSCDHLEQTRRWVSYPTVQGDVHKQITAVCHYLFVNDGSKQTGILESQLRTRTAMWSTAVQLAACSRNSRIAQLAARQVVSTKNAAVFATSLQSDFTLHYNVKFRSAFWTELGNLEESELRLLFPSNGTMSPATKILIHSVRTIEELKQVRSLVSDWDGRIGRHMEYVERELRWRDRIAATILTPFLSGDATL